MNVKIGKIWCYGDPKKAEVDDKLWYSWIHFINGVETGRWPRFQGFDKAPEWVNVLTDWGVKINLLLEKKGYNPKAFNFVHTRLYAYTMVKDENSDPTTRWEDWQATGFASLTIANYLIEDLGPTGFRVAQYFIGRMDKIQGQVEEVKRYLTDFSQSL